MAHYTPATTRVWWHYAAAAGAAFVGIGGYMVYWQREKLRSIPPYDIDLTSPDPHGPQSGCGSTLLSRVACRAFPDTSVACYVHRGGKYVSMQFESSPQQGRGERGGGLVGVDEDTDTASTSSPRGTAPFADVDRRSSDDGKRGTPVDAAEGTEAVNWGTLGRLMGALSGQEASQSVVKCKMFEKRNNRCIPDGTYLEQYYMRLMLMAFAMRPLPFSTQLSVCVLGMGGGSLPTFLQHSMSTQVKNLSVVDVEPAVVDAATRHLGFKPSMSLLPADVHVEDALEHIAATPNSHDIVLVDVFLGSTVPKHLGTATFFHAVRSSLRINGAAAFNFPSKHCPELKKLREVFGDGCVYVVPCRGSSNVVALATTAVGTKDMKWRHIYKRAWLLGNAACLPFDLSAHLPVPWQLSGAAYVHQNL